MNQQIKMGLVSGISFGVLIAIPYCLMFGVKLGISAAIISGITFGGFMLAFGAAQSKQFKNNIPSELAGKEIVFQAGANHYNGIEGVGGWLYMTNDELFFQSHEINVQVHFLAIPFGSIKSVQSVNLLGVITTQMNVEMKDSTVEKFIVWNRQEWIDKINQKIS